MSSLYERVAERVQQLKDSQDPNSQNYNPVSRYDDEFASKTLANIRKAQWAEYKNKQPAIQKNYINMAMGDDLTNEQVGRVEGNVNRSFDRSRQNQQATLSRMGVQNDVKDDGIAQSLAIAHGENSVRQHGDDRRLNAIAGGNLPTLQTQGNN